MQFSLNGYDIVIGVVSTTGQGDLPANTRIFWKSLLRKKLLPGCLRDVKFTTFGLGDRSYPKFNWAARKLHKRFLQLGASEIYPRGEADEQHEEGLDASFVPWSAGFRSHILGHFPLEDGEFPIPEHVLLEPKWLLSEDIGYVNGSKNHEGGRYNEEYKSANGGNGTEYKIDSAHATSGSSANDNNQCLTIEVQQNRRVTPETHWQDVRHLAFTNRTSAPYGPGDVLTIYPQNPSESVNEIISMMNWANVADEVVKFVPTTTKHLDTRYPPPLIVIPRDSKLTLRYLLTNHLDIMAIPRRSFFSLIAHFTSDQFHKDRLLEFVDPKYVDELYDYTTRPRRSLLEVLQEFETVKIPWQWAASVLPELRGRQFSIASGGHLKTNVDGSARFELLVAIVKYRTVIKRIREGVCTKYLANLKPGDRVFASLQKGGLDITKADFHTPVIMVGPGTGVAPMRSLVWERLLWKEDSMVAALGNSNESMTHKVPLGSNLLFFGCRNENADFFYKDEWNKLRYEGTLELYTAFSRDQLRKHYVQDLIREHSCAIYDMLHSKRATVYVCGSSGKMPIAVRAALVDVIRECGRTHGSTPMSEEAALRYMEAMAKEGRYKQETW